MQRRKLYFLIHFSQLFHSAMEVDSNSIKKVLKFKQFFSQLAGAERLCHAARVVERPGLMISDLKFRVAK
jgi:hypothetical protein